MCPRVACTARMRQDLFFVEVPMFNKDGEMEIIVKHPVLLPHEMFASLFHQGQMSDALLGPGGEPQAAS